MRVLSLNCWGGRLGLGLVDYLRCADADLLCLQEVVHAPGCPHEWLIYRDDGGELPQRANLFREIAEALPSHAGFFCPAARGELFHGEQAVATDWGLATFVRRELVVIGQAQGFVHGDYAAAAGGQVELAHRRLHPRGEHLIALRLQPEGGQGLAPTAAALGLASVPGVEGAHAPCPPRSPFKARARA